MYDPLGMSGECAGCDVWQPLDDMGLCDSCAAKLDRDMIRERAWEYSATAFACAPEDYEALRQQIIAAYGAAYELIVPEGKDKKRKSK